MLGFTRFTLARQFLLVSFLILLVGMVVIGLWVGRQIETGVINRTAGVTALYVDSFIAPYVQGLGDGGLSDGHLRALDSLLSDTPLGQRIVAFKIWNPDGRVLYSNNPSLIGRKFPVLANLAAAFAGDVRAKISTLDEPENEYERQRWSRLIETYAPVRTGQMGSIVAVAEFYQTTDELQHEVRAAQWRSWLVVVVATLAMYLLLAGLVGRASRTISAQQVELRGKVGQLQALLAQNQHLHTRVRRAAARATALNERFLRRISADLHDGPAQDVSLALLRLDALTTDSRSPGQEAGNGEAVSKDFKTLHSALQSALNELQAIAAGLRLPELEHLSPAATAYRAMHDYERKTGHAVVLALQDLPGSAPLPVKITLYRVLQESLANGFRHAAGSGQRVEIAHIAGQLAIQVSDDGPGFDPRAISGETHLGLTAMRERVEILGGTFSIDSETGRGTAVRACLPLFIAEEDGE
ncbi:MAG: sensor histidine kinase [Candidatus Lambdaproteobacteria bacterium]|nr:sensor histidine kinase [Candidatus Lambdaproteobacteria bacterium]